MMRSNTKLRALRHAERDIRRNAILIHATFFQSASDTRTIAITRGDFALHLMMRYGKNKHCPVLSGSVSYARVIRYLLGRSSHLYDLAENAPDTR
jgi:hypothetical protein